MPRIIGKTEVSLSVAFCPVPSHSEFYYVTYEELSHSYEYRSVVHVSKIQAFCMDYGPFHNIFFFPFFFLCGKIETHVYHAMRQPEQTFICIISPFRLTCSIKIHIH